MCAIMNGRHAPNSSSACPCFSQSSVHDYGESARKPRGMTGFGAVFSSLKPSATPVCLVWGPVEGDKPLSLIPACFLPSSQVLPFSSSFCIIIIGVEILCSWKTASNDPHLDVTERIRFQMQQGGLGEWTHGNNPPVAIIQGANWPRQGLWMQPSMSFLCEEASSASVCVCIGLPEARIWWQMHRHQVPQNLM